jgi:hypothetical protein
LINKPMIKNVKVIKCKSTITDRSESTVRIRSENRSEISIQGSTGYFIFSIIKTTGNRLKCYKNKECN